MLKEIKENLNDGMTFRVHGLEDLMLLNGNTPHIKLQILPKLFSRIPGDWRT